MSRETPKSYDPRHAKRYHRDYMEAILSGNKSGSTGKFYTTDCVLVPADQLCNTEGEQYEAH